jgi:hypothetical protein
MVQFFCRFRNHFLEKRRIPLRPSSQSSNETSKNIFAGE